MIKLGPDRWRLQVAVDSDLVTGERRRLSRTVVGSRSDAKEASQRLVVEAGAGRYGGGRVTVGGLLDQYLGSATLGARTREDRQSPTTRHLKPALGELPLWKLTARDCDRLYARMAAQGLGPSRVRCAHVVLHRAVAQAVRWGWLTRNPVSAATRPPGPRTTIDPPSVDDVRRLLDQAWHADVDLWCWLQVAVASGARRGEICALRWCDVDLDDRVARIDRCVTATAADGIIITCTTTDRPRVASLTRQAAAALAGRRAGATDAAQTAGVELADTSLILSVDPGGVRPWRPDAVTARWGRLRASAGLPRIRIHDLRHFVATELRSAGIDIRTVANRLGHARTSTTLDVYWGWVPARDREAADHLDTLLDANAALTSSSSNRAGSKSPPAQVSMVSCSS